MPPHVFVLLLEGKANFNGCRIVTMPSADAMAQAPPDIINRFQAIKEVNFNGMGNLAGELYVRGRAQRLLPKNLPVWKPS